MICFQSSVCTYISMAVSLKHRTHEASYTTDYKKKVTHTFELCRIDVHFDRDLIPICI